MGYTYPELQKWLPAYKSQTGAFDNAKYQASIRVALEQTYSTTGKAVTLLPGMEETAKKLMGACSEESAKYENFPPALLKLRETLLGQAIKATGEVAKATGQAVQAGASLIGDVGGALFGGGMSSKPKPGAPAPRPGEPKPFVDFSWESQDYICNILYDRYVFLDSPTLVFR